MVINPNDKDQTKSTLSTQHSLNILRKYEAPQLYNLNEMPIEGGNYSNFTENSGGVFQSHS